jgi:thiol:disulfide interchange protein
MDVGAGQHKPQPTPIPSNQDREPFTIPAWVFWVAYGLSLALFGWLIWAMLRKAGVKAASSWVIAILFVAAALGLLGVFGIQIALADPHDFNLGSGTWPGSGVWGYPPWQYPLGPPSTVFRP